MKKSNVIAAGHGAEGHGIEATKALAHELAIHCRSFTKQDNFRATWQLVSTVVPFVAICMLIVKTLGDHYWISLCLSIPAGSLLVRLFLLQHDCGHGSFFVSRYANEIVGRTLSLLTFTPFSYWRTTHAIHHATTGNLERRGVGDVFTFTASEYGKLSWGTQFRYRLLRNPLTSIIFGPPIYFLVLQRVPGYMGFRNRSELLSIIMHDVALILFYCSLVFVLGFEVVLFGFLPIVVFGSWVGAFLFNVQHQFEETLWENADKWDVKTAALLGSSHLQLPAILNWFTCDIGLHHIHHLSSRIPNYRLRDCMKASEGLANIAPKLSLWKALTSVHLALWDETERRLISFGEFRQRKLA